MSTRIEDMKNLGPATARMLAEIDVLCEEICAVSARLKLTTV